MPSPRSTALIGLGIGLGAGVLSGVFGVGGGSLIVPGLVLLLHRRQHEASATSLAAILITAPAALIPFLLAGQVAVVPALLLCCGSLLGAYVGAGAMRRVPAAALRRGFAAVLALVVVRLLLADGADSQNATVAIDLATAAGLVTLGLVAGLLSALLGVGGGIVIVPALVLLFGFGPAAAAGTSLLVIVPTALVGAARHTRSGYVDWRLGIVIGAAGAVGGPLGAALALNADSALVRRAFAVFLALIVVQLLRPATSSQRIAEGHDAGDAVGPIRGAEDQHAAGVDGQSGT